MEPDIAFSTIGVSDKHVRYFRNLMGYPNARPVDFELDGIWVPIADNMSRLGDFLTGPSSTFVVSSRVREALDDVYGAVSDFTPCTIEGSSARYFVWVLNKFETLIDPAWERVSHIPKWNSEEVDWLPDRILETDVVRENQYKSHWYCVYRGAATSCFFNLARKHEWTGLWLVEQWRKEP